MIMISYRPAKTQYSFVNHLSLSNCVYFLQPWYYLDYVCYWFLCVIGWCWVEKSLLRVWLPRAIFRTVRLQNLIFAWISIQFEFWLFIPILFKYSFPIKCSFSLLLFLFINVRLFVHILIPFSMFICCISYKSLDEPDWYRWWKWYTFPVLKS